MEKKSLSLWAPILVIAAALLMLAVGADTVDAARGGVKGPGNGGGVCHGKKCDGGGETGTAVLTVTPNPVPLGSQSIDISGAGFAPNQEFGVFVFGVCCGMVATSDSNGNFTVTFYRDFDWPTTYTVNAYNSTSLVASTTFTVQ